MIEKYTYSYEPVFEKHVPKECRLFPERARETDLSLQEKLMNRIDKYIVENGQEDLENMNVPSECRDELYMLYFSTSPATKIGGLLSIYSVDDPMYPTCSCGRSMEHLLTVVSSDIGDSLTCYR